MKSQRSTQHGNLPHQITIGRFQTGARCSSDKKTFIRALAYCMCRLLMENGNSSEYGWKTQWAKDMRQHGGRGWICRRWLGSIDEHAKCLYRSEFSTLHFQSYRTHYGPELSSTSTSKCVYVYTMSVELAFDEVCVRQKYHSSTWTIEKTIRRTLFSPRYSVRAVSPYC